MLARQTLRARVVVPTTPFVRALSTSLPRRLPSSSSSSSASTPKPTGALASAAETISETFSSLTDKFKEAVQHSHSEQYEGVEEQGLRMLVFGKPGSGKGTLSARLVKDYDIAFVSTGDVLRKEIAAGSEVGKKAEAVVASGGLVSDELMLEIVKAELDRLRGRSWIIDGFPRTLHQGELLDTVLNQENRPLNMIVHLNVPDSVIMARISARWVHLPSGRVYNTTYSAPKVPGRDDVTGEPLSKRPDDTPETFSKRLHAYYESTAPLLEYFASTYPDSLFSLSGSSSDEVLIALGLKKPAAAAAAPAPAAEAAEATPTVQGKGRKIKSDQRTCTSVLSASSSSSSDPANETENENENPNSNCANAALDQLWPQLQNLIEPFGLRRKTGSELRDEDVGGVRKEADDLRDPAEAEGKRKKNK